MKRESFIPSVLLLSAFAWCAGIVAAPLLAAAGEGAGAGALYEFYGRMCHQLDGHSWHLAGHPLGVCIRCSAIYAGFTLGTLLWIVLPSARARLKRVSRPVVFIGALIMALDVALNLPGIHFSTALSRTITGGMFGSAAPWLIVPHLVDAIGTLRAGRSGAPSHGELTHD